MVSRPRLTLVSEGKPLRRFEVRSKGREIGIFAVICHGRLLSAMDKVSGLDAIIRVCQIHQVLVVFFLAAFFLAGAFLRPLPVFAARSAISSTAMAMVTSSGFTSLGMVALILSHFT